MLETTVGQQNRGEAYSVTKGLKSENRTNLALEILVELK